MYIIQSFIQVVFELLVLNLPSYTAWVRVDSTPHTPAARERSLRPPPSCASNHGGLYRPAVPGPCVIHFSEMRQYLTVSRRNVYDT